MTEENLRNKENNEFKKRSNTRNSRTKEGGEAKKRTYQRRTRKKEEIANENTAIIEKEEKDKKIGTKRKYNKKENNIFKQSKLKIIPLGGLHEIGKNITSNFGGYHERINRFRK